MIVNLPQASGYSDSKGLFAARKAIMQYTQQKGIAGVERRRHLRRQRRLRADRDVDAALLDDGDEVLVPARRTIRCGRRR